MEVYSDGYVCRLRVLRQKYGISLQELYKTKEPEKPAAFPRFRALQDW